MLLNKLTLILSSALLMGLLTACSTNSDHKNTAQASENNHSQAEPYLLLDVRSEDEYAKDGLKQAVFMPFDKINADAISAVVADKNTPIKVYCRSGRRAGVAMETLTEMGYTNVENLKTVKGAVAYVEKYPVD